MNNKKKWLSLTLSVMLMSTMVWNTYAEWWKYVNDWEVLTSTVWNDNIDKMKEISSDFSNINTNINSLKTDKTTIEWEVTKIEGDTTNTINKWDADWDWKIDASALPYKKWQLIWWADWKLDTSLTSNSDYFSFYDESWNKIKASDFKKYVEKMLSLGLTEV